MAGKLSIPLAVLGSVAIVLITAGLFSHYSAHPDLVAEPPHGEATIEPQAPRAMAESAGEAVSFSRDVILGTPRVSVDIESMAYTETTIGTLREVFGEPRSNGLDDPANTIERLEAPDEWPVWAIVARGAFQEFHMGLAEHQDPPYHVFWLFVLKGRQGMTWFTGETGPHIELLGTPRYVDLPLEQWPAPVVLLAPRD